ncbi:MAG: hypothetical protein IRY99_04095, partial [Isosphaeraceae bacterium]|nr:hypothetical protein [Isosphaeraceae bacterium]
MPHTESKTEYKIARVTPAGSISVFAMPGEASDLTTGPDGALWSAANQIDRITTDGSVSEFRGLTTSPMAIASGPDGALWFTELAPKIGRIDPTTHAVTEFPFLVGGPGTAQTAITAGPDGGLWIIKGALPTGQIRRFDPVTHELTNVPLPDGLAEGYAPPAITVGPDGALWFPGVSSAGGGPAKPVIVRLDPRTYASTLFDVPTDERLDGIATGPDGNIWFAEQDHNRIGQLVLGTQLTATASARAVPPGVAFSGLTASFTATFADVTPNLAPGLFTAAIDWGDGSPASVGTIVADGRGGFQVLGSHTYTQTNTFPVTTTIRGAGGLSTTAVGTIAVSPASTPSLPNGGTPAGPNSGPMGGG